MWLGTSRGKADGPKIPSKFRATERFGDGCPSRKTHPGPHRVVEVRVSRSVRAEKRGLID